MLRFAADENFSYRIVRGLLRRKPLLDILPVQEVGLTGADDPTVLEWAASEGRILLTHDAATMIQFAAERVRAGQRMPGLFEVPQQTPLRVVIEDLLLIADCSLDDEWEGQVQYLPLR